MSRHFFTQQMLGALLVSAMAMGINAQAPLGVTLESKEALSGGPRQRHTSPFAVQSAYLPSTEIPKPFEAPHRVAYVAGGEALVINANNWGGQSSTGLYTLPVHGSPNRLYPIVLSPKLTCNSGSAFFDGKLLTANFVSFYGSRCTYTLWDAKTFEKLGSGDLGEAFKAYSMAYDPVGKVIYATIDDWRNKSCTLVKLSTDNFKITEVKQYQEFYPSDLGFYTLACDQSGSLYGMTKSGEFYLINKTTGGYTKIGDTKTRTDYQTSMAFNPDNGKLYYITTQDGGSTLYMINPTTAEATSVYNLPAHEEIVGLNFPGTSYSGNVPSYPDDISASCEGGSMFANIKFTATGTTTDGNPLTGALNYTIYANGEKVNAGTTEAGAATTSSFGATVSGYYDIEVTLSNDSGEGPGARTTLFIGHDKPLPVEKVELKYIGDVVNLTWSEAKSEHGEYFDINAVAYRVTRYPDAKIVEQGTRANVFSEEYPAPDPGHKIYYTVEAMYNGVTSDPTTSNKVLAGTFGAPYYEDFVDDNSFDEFTVIDANNDGATWKCRPGAGSCSYTYHRENDADDYVVLPAMKLKGDNGYFFSIEAAGSSSSPYEKIEIWAGTSPTKEGLSTCLLESTDLPWKATQGTAKHEVLFMAPADGLYYFAVRCVSEAFGGFCYIYNVKVSEAIALNAPGAVTDLKAEADPSGDLKVDISFKAPETSVDGSVLTELSKVELYRNDVLLETFNPAPGEAVNWSDTDIVAGDNTYTVIPYNSGGRGLSATVTVFVGFETPAMPKSITVAKGTNDGQVHVSWAQIDTDIAGRPLPSEKVTYRVARWEWAGDLLLPYTLVDDYSALTHTDQACDADAKQKFVQYSAQGKNYAGIGKYVGSRMIAVGRAYTLPFAESFKDQNIGHEFTVELTGGGTWSLANDQDYTDVQSFDSDNGFLVFSATEVNSWANITSGVIDLGKGDNPTMSFYYYNLGSDYGDILQLLIDRGQGIENLGEPFVLGKSGTPGWTKHTVNLSAFKGQKIQVGFRVTAKTHGVAALDGLRVYENYNHNLAAIGISAPPSVTANSQFTIGVTVMNQGIEKAGEFTVDLISGGQVVASTTRYDLVSEGVNTVDFTTSADLFTGGSMKYHAEVKYAPDQEESDNKTSEVTVVVESPLHPAPVNLTATIGSDKNFVDLSWTKPVTENLPPLQTLDNFDTYPSFATGSAGAWTFVDNDGKGVGNFAEFELPNITATEPASFFIFDSSEYNASLAAYSGIKYLAALYNADGSANDDWAISPELYGGSQTISFMARSYSENYPETLEVMFSTSGRSLSDFRSAEIFSEMDAQWKRYTVELPEGARFFALRFISANTFMLMIDDVNYTPKGAVSPVYDLLGYNIYRNTSKVASLSASETSWRDTEVKSGVHTYHATAIYSAHGESGLSNNAVADFNLSGISGLQDTGVTVTTEQYDIIVEGAEGMSISIVASDGKVVSSKTAVSAREVLSVAQPGIYILRIGCYVTKVAIR